MDRSAYIQMDRIERKIDLLLELDGIETDEYGEVEESKEEIEEEKKKYM